MNKSPWRKILVRVAISMIFVGMMPTFYLLWWIRTHNLRPLSMAISLKQGVYTSPFFPIDLDDLYRIDIDSLPGDRTPVVLDWEIVSDTGAVVQSGGFTDPYLGGTGAIVGEYRAKRGSREQLVVTIHQDVQAAESHPRITIGLPERGLRLAEEDSFLALGWAAIVSGSGLIMLFVLLGLEAGTTKNLV